MDYHFEFKFYRRSFRRPLKTGHGTWTTREGILVRLEDGEGNIGYGEIAPLPSFGTESIEEACAYCRDLKGQFNDHTLELAEPNLPACRFALENARELLRDICGLNTGRKVPVAALLPSGGEALNFLDHYSSWGFKTYKWKIGIDEIESEQSVFEELVSASPGDVKFRLDANGALTLRQAEEWLGFLDNHNIEFLEQPLPPTESKTIFEIADKYSTPLALDESVSSIESLKSAAISGWPGFLVVKPSIMGSPLAFRAWVEQCNCPLIFSSVFETAVGFQAGLQLAAEYGVPGYAAGYGINSYFLSDGLSLHGEGPELNPNQCSLKDFEKIWKQIGKN